MDIKIIRSNRKSFSIRIASDLSISMRVPLNASEKQIEEVLREKEAWIIKHLELVKKRNENLPKELLEPLTYPEIKKLADRAVEYIPKRVEHFAKIIGVDYARITIRNQKTRWGSCSSKGNLNFNCLLMLAPLEVIDYVVVHELCHIKEMNHSAAFWSEVEKVIPDYSAARKWLAEEGSVLIKRLPSRSS